MTDNNRNGFLGFLNNRIPHVLRHLFKKFGHSYKYVPNKHKKITKLIESFIIHVAPNFAFRFHLSEHVALLYPKLQRHHGIQIKHYNKPEQIIAIKIFWLQ